MKKVISPYLGLIQLLFCIFSISVYSQSLSYHDLSSGDYVFDQWSATADAGAYPPHALFHVYMNEPELADEPSGLWYCRYDLTTRARINGLDNDGISLFNTGSKLTTAQCRSVDGTENGGYIGDMTVGLNTLGRDNVQLNFTAELLNQGSGNPTPRVYGLRLQYRIGSAGTWTDLSSPIEFNTQNRVAGEVENYSEIVLPSTCNDQAEVEVRWKYYAVATNDGGSRPRVRLDDITITSDEIDPADPILSVDGSLLNFEHYIGTPSTEQTVIVSGENLTSAILVATTSPFEISLTPENGFDTELSLSPTGTSLLETTIYIRMNAAQEGYYSNLFSLSGGGVSTATNILLNGTATIYVPPYNLSFPTPHHLKNDGTYTLNEWPANSSAGSYPDHGIFHVFENEPHENDEPVTDWMCVYDFSARSRINGLNEDGFSFFNTSSSQSDSQCGNADGTSVGGYVGDFVVAVNTLEMENIRLSFLIELLNQSSGSPLPRNYGLKLMYRTDELSPWLNLPDVEPYETGEHVQGEITTYANLLLPEELSNQELVQIRWHYYSINSNDGGSRPRIRLDDFSIEGEEIRILNPTVTITETLNSFHQIIGSPSEPQLFLVEGTELLHPLEIEVPYPYIISLSEEENYTTQLSLTPTNESISLTPIFVKLNAAETGVYPREINLSTADAIINETISIVGEAHTETVVPVVTTNTDSLISFVQSLGNPSATQFFILNGTNLTDSLHVFVNAPFEISSSSNGPFYSSMKLFGEDGAVELQPLLVRLNGQLAGDYQATLYITGGGLTSPHEIQLLGTTLPLPTPSFQFETDSMSSLNQTINGTSIPQVVNVSGEHLQEPVELLVSAPFEISTTTDANFSSTVSITDNSFTTPIYIRLNAIVADTFSGTLVAQSTEITDTLYLEGITHASQQPELLYYWHFNHVVHQLEEVNQQLALTQALEPDYKANSLSSQLIGTGFIDSRTGSTELPVSNQNLKLGVPPNAGGWLRINNPTLASEITLELSTENYQEISLDFALVRNELGAQFYNLLYSIDNGTAWNSIVENKAIPVLYHQSDWEHNSFDLSTLTELNNKTNLLVKLTFEGTNTTASDGFVLLDNLSLKGVQLEEQNNPTISVEPLSLAPFYQVGESPSAEAVFILTVENGGGAVTLQAPTNYEIKTLDDGNFTSTLNLLTNNGELSSIPLQIRLHAESYDTQNDTLTIATDNHTFNLPLFGFKATDHTPDDGELLYYWHFNELNTVLNDVKIIPSDFSITDSVFGVLTYEGSGIRDLSATPFGAIENLQQNAIAGQGLSVHNSTLNRALLFDLPTTGLSHILMEYVVKRDVEGMKGHNISYSTDGITFTEFPHSFSSLSVSERYTLFQLDFSSISEVNYNPNFKVRIQFEGNKTLLDGTNYIDNITLKGDASRLGLADKTMNIVSIYPNPFESTVYLSSSQKVSKLEVYTATGKLVWEAAPNKILSKEPIQLDLFNSGIYFIKLYDQQGGVEFEKLIKK